MLAFNQKTQDQHKNDPPADKQEIQQLEVEQSAVMMESQGSEQQVQGDEIITGDQKCQDQLKKDVMAASLRFQEQLQIDMLALGQSFQKQLHVDLCSVIQKCQQQQVEQTRIEAITEAGKKFSLELESNHRKLEVVKEMFRHRLSNLVSVTEMTNQEWRFEIGDLNQYSQKWWDMQCKQNQLTATLQEQKEKVHKDLLAAYQKIHLEHLEAEQNTLVAASQKFQEELETVVLAACKEFKQQLQNDSLSASQNSQQLQEETGQLLAANQNSQHQLQETNEQLIVACKNSQHWRQGEKKQLLAASQSSQRQLQEESAQLLAVSQRPQRQPQKETLECSAASQNSQQQLQEKLEQLLAASQKSQEQQNMVAASACQSCHKLPQGEQLDLAAAKQVCQKKLGQQLGNCYRLMSIFLQVEKYIHSVLNSLKSVINFANLNVIREVSLNVLALGAMPINYLIL